MTEISTASTQEGVHPRPQMLRRMHTPLDREVLFAYDDADVGVDEHWEDELAVFGRRIQLPFAPESAASGVGDTGFHPVVWYRIPITQEDLSTSGLGQQGDRILLHFGAVDYLTDVWVDGNHVCRNEGGQVPFFTDITSALRADADEHVIVVRAEDDPQDLTMPRGKQDWLEEPHSIWYHRSTGIWRTVWLEAVPSLRVQSLAWTTDLENAVVRAEVALNRRPEHPVAIRIEVAHQGRSIAAVSVHMGHQHLTIDMTLPEQRNGQHYENLLWTPETPHLLDATVAVTDVAGGGELDVVGSYLGLRSSSVQHGEYLLNSRPYYVRSVLEQGYWPQSLFTPPSLMAMREEVELIKSLGFNATRIHQKVEDPRFLYWADRLGLLVWGETASAYEFSAKAVMRLTSEWARIIEHYRSHPSIVAWVPVNESWGVQQIAHLPMERSYVRALTELTRSLDDTRPVISNDGWEHLDSDIWTVHDYESSGSVLRARYGSAETIDALLDGFGPSRRRMALNRGADGKHLDRGQPVMLTEFGGVSFDMSPEVSDSWGYSAATSTADFEERVQDVLAAVNGSPILRGFCYTQLTDTRQETNGLCDENRVPKLPSAVISRLVRGADD